MSDAPSAPASAPAGPASSSDSQLTGRFAEEAKHGYREMRPSSNGLPTPPKRTEREFETGRQAADELAKKRRKQGHTAPEARPVEYRDEHGRAAPKNETVTIERATTDLEGSRFTDVVEKELRDRHELANNVDKLRRDAGVPTDPNAPGDPNQMSADLFGELQQRTPQIDPQNLPQNMQPQQAPPGIDPELHRAMQHPQVRQAMEEEFGKATKLQTHYSERVQVANDFAFATVVTAFPELAGMKTNAQITGFLNQLQQTDPARFKQATTMLNNFARAHVERQNIERQRQHAERQNFQRESAAQDAAFAKSVANVPVQQRIAVAQEAINYAASLGIDQGTLEHLMATNPILRHSAFRRMMFDAAAGSLARKQFEAQRQQQRAANIPPVARPGSGAPRTTPQSANLQALNARLNNTGDAKDAAALLIAQRNARRR